MQRRLAAIVSADVVGYSALMATDEEGTLARLTAYREELIGPAIAAHGGRIFKLMGDGILAEFPSAVQAVRAAVEAQRRLTERNAEAPTEHRITFRIGINQGDVVVDGEDIYGDGVNIATRLQERATAGGICISERVYGDVRGRIDVGIDDLGDQELKNIPEPVRVYRVLAGVDSGMETARWVGVKWRRRTLLSLIGLALLIAVAGGAAWHWISVSTSLRPILSETAKPSIAVLPFANLSKSADDDYFADGMTNDLINDLSKFSDMLVIASNSVFTYKGRAVNVQEVSRELGVRYVVEGSVQRAGQRVRINVQLAEGSSGQQLWADRHDEDIEDLFDLQERITRHIVSTLAVRLTQIEQQRAFDKPTDNLEAYDYVLRGRALLRKAARRETFQAREMFRRAIELDPDYASAYAGLGFTHMFSMLYGWTGSPKKDIDLAEKLAQKALALSGISSEGHQLLARVYLTRRQYDLAMVEAERAIAINPNDADGHVEQAYVMLVSGRTDGALLALERAARSSPVQTPEYYWYLGVAYYLKAQYQDAVTILERNAHRRGHHVDYMMLAAAYAQWGRTNEAAVAAQLVRRVNPFFSVDDVNLFRSDTDRKKIVDGLRKAGLN